MCILCNTDIEHVKVAADFLSKFAATRHHMKAAADAMLAMSKVALPEHRDRYKMIHKQMVRQIRSWNSLEHKREQR